MMAEDIVDAPDVVPEEETNFGRQFQHNTNAFWDSTGKKIINSVMSPLGIAFDDTEVEDLEGDNSTVMMSEFVERCKRRPPVSAHTRSPFKADSLMKTLSTAIRLLKDKFRNASQNLPPFFPDDLEKSWRKRLKDDLNRNMMQGEDESEVLKNIFPLPRKHGIRTKVLPDQSFPEDIRTQAEQVDMLKLAKQMHLRNSYTDLAALLITYSAIGRGGEVKFLNYGTFHFDTTFNILFVQWF